MNPPSPREGDAGLSLIELIVVVVLIGILAGAVGTILTNSWRAQNDVTSTTKATNAGQLVGQSIERAVRNGVALQVTDGGSKLWVRTAYSDSRQCQVFWVSGSNKLYMSRAISGASLPSPDAWAANVSQVTSFTPYFALSTSGTTVTYAFDLGTDASPVVIAGNESLRGSTGLGGTCWS